MATWLEDVITAFKNLSGVSHYSDLYEEVKRIRKKPLPKSWQAIIRRTIESHSSDSEAFLGREDLFYSVKGIGSGIWGLRNFNKPKIASDIEEPTQPDRVETTVYRVLRDTSLARDLKLLYNHRCQICGDALEISNGEYYSEAHHIKPLGNPHNGPDIAENIIILCPNHHVLCDYGAIELDISDITMIDGHYISIEFIDYHNKNIYKKE